MLGRCSRSVTGMFSGRTNHEQTKNVSRETMATFMLPEQTVNKTRTPRKVFHVKQ